MNYCTRCRGTNNLYRFDKKSNRYICRSCNTEKCKAYRKRTNCEAAKRAAAKYEKAHPERRKAWSKANYRIKTSLPCEVCGAEKVHKHHDDPNLPYDVYFLCPAHHKMRHELLNNLRKMKEAGLITLGVKG